MTRLSSRQIPWLVAGASIAILAAAHILEAMGMLPCELCLRQREAYWIALAFALGAAALPYWKGVPTFLAPLLMALVGSCASLWHGPRVSTYRRPSSTGGRPPVAAKERSIIRSPRSWPAPRTARSSSAMRPRSSSASRSRSTTSSPRWSWPVSQPSFLSASSDRRRSLR